MKYSRMEKYHSKDNKDKEKHLNISDEELNKNLEDLSYHSKKVNKFIGVSKFIGIIAIVMIAFTYILYIITGDTANKNNSSQNEPKQTRIAKSSENRNNNSITNSEDENNVNNNDINSNKNKFSDNQQNQNLQQANNHMFSSLEEAKEYGISCINKGICNNYSVQNIGNGMYQVILE